MASYDIVGDVHGCADKLKGLLKQLGYRQRAGAFQHSERQAIFVGDLIDRGRQQVETVEIVRSMVDAGAALVTMGNHEFNAISFVTPDRRAGGDFMRPSSGPKGPKNRAQHASFLEQVIEGSALHIEYVKWFKTLPLWLELGGVRVAHACWHDASIAFLRRTLGHDQSMSEEFLIEANINGTATFEAVDTVLKGPEIELGDQHVFVDKDKHHRSSARIRWWDRRALTLQEVAEIPPDSKRPDGQPFPALPDDPCPEAEQYRYEEETPVFFGHYWFTGARKIAGPATVCLDYSAVSGGALVAYRWDGEEVLSEERFRAFPND